METGLGNPVEHMRVLMTCLLVAVTFAGCIDDGEDVRSCAPVDPELVPLEQIAADPLNFTHMNLITQGHLIYGGQNSVPEPATGITHVFHSFSLSPQRDHASGGMSLDLREPETPRELFWASTVMDNLTESFYSKDLVRVSVTTGDERFVHGNWLGVPVVHEAAAYPC